jgi:hypothetical protein
MDRMAKHTKQPEVLHELFEALGNDPFLIAECLARPALADRLLTNWYAYDQRIHGELKQRAQAELRMRPSVEHMKQLSCIYSEIEFTKDDSGETVRQAHRLPYRQSAGGAPALQPTSPRGRAITRQTDWQASLCLLGGDASAHPQADSIPPCGGGL